MKNKYLFFSVLIFIIVMVLGIYIYSKYIPTISQGIYGRVILRSGDCMPGAGDDCKIFFVSRTIYIREPIKNTLVKQIKSNQNGFFQVELAPGKYSIFVEDNGKEYCNWFDSHGENCPITLGNELLKRDIIINHAAE